MNNKIQTTEKINNLNILFWSLQIGGWGLFTLLNLAGRQYFVHFHFSELVNSIVLGVCLIISTGGLRKFYQYKLKAKSLLTGFLQILVCSMIAALGTILLYAVVIVPNQVAIFNTKDELLWQQILLSSPMIFFLILAWSAIYVMFKKQQQLKYAQQEQDTLVQSLKAARLEVLLSQINPHFIFNAINNIRALILEDTNKARDMLADLSGVMRYTMQIDREELILFSEEIEVVKQFIALNKLQFEDKLQVQYNVVDKTLNYSLPPMILQLLIENALKHGIGKLKQGGKVVITSQSYEHYWTITVENSGELLLDTAQNHENPGVGIKNIKQRLSLVYGEQASFSLASSSRGVIATIKLPL
jgi:sensor histidine kinase YesM